MEADGVGGIGGVIPAVCLLPAALQAVRRLKPLARCAKLMATRRSSEPKCRSYIEYPKSTDSTNTVVLVSDAVSPAFLFTRNSRRSIASGRMRVLARLSGPVRQ